jgi:hypothetical protein
MNGRAMKRPPRGAHQHEFHRLEEIYYGTDDGHPETGPDYVFDEAGTESEFAALEDFRRRAGSRTADVHLVSVVGGFYGLNLVPLFRPRRITLFDINPHQITYALLIARVLGGSRDAPEFLDRLRDGDYEVRSEDERALRENLALKQRGCLPRSRGRSKRSLARSWRYALENFELTRRILSEVPIATRIDAMQSPGFADFVRDLDNAWIYCSNVLLFTHFELEIADPRNVVLCARYFDQLEILDLAAHAGRRVKVRCAIPMSVREVRRRRSAGGG